MGIRSLTGPGFTFSSGIAHSAGLPAANGIPLGFCGAGLGGAGLGGSNRLNGSFNDSRCFFAPCAAVLPSGALCPKAVAPMSERRIQAACLMRKFYRHFLPSAHAAPKLRRYFL